MTLIFFIKLLLAHLTGDFLLQPNKWVAHKNLHKINSKFLYCHILIHAGLVIIVLELQFKYWLGMMLIVFTHFIIDLTKIYLQKETNRRFLFIADQIMHIGFLLIMTQMYFPFSTFNFPLNINSVILFVTAVILVTNVAAVVIQVFIARWDSRTEPNEKQSEGLEKAGFYIGILERLLVFSFIVLNHWEGVGFLLAAKSIFRFGDPGKSKDRKLTEYILIGTLLSFGFAMAVALLYLNIKQWII